ncbi:MAG: pyruvate kinase [Candidatus Paceibacterales bacterium]
MSPLTKIIATLGPACQNEERIQSLVRKGVNVFRFNLKHNTLKWHKSKINLVRKVSRKLKKPLGVLVDLEGSELRIGKFKNKNSLELREGETVILSKGGKEGAYKVIPVPKIKELFSLTPNQKIFIDDGRFEFLIKKNEKDRIYTKVVTGGVLKERKTINLPGLYLKSKTNLKQSLSTLKFCLGLKVDYIALSFVRDKKEILEYKKFFRNYKNRPWIISKIETKEAIKNLDEILENSDGVIVARGDLGVEIPLEKVPLYQKMIVNKCLVKGKPVIIATHLLESMVENPRATRAEVSDVANALYDLADGLLLSAETAHGKYAELSVSTLRKIANFIEKQKPEKSELPFEIKTQVEAICFGAFHLYKSEFCQKQNVKAFVVLSQTGKTVRSLSRLRPYLPVFVLTENKSLVEKSTIIFGTFPFYLNFKGLYQKKGVKEIQKILNFLKKDTFLKRGDKIILIYGEDWGISPGRTSVMRVQEIA